MRTVVLIPTYNNETTICDVVRRCLLLHQDVMVVCDGCTDNTLTLLRQMRETQAFFIVSYSKNKGKGTALKIGFKKALEMGYTHALTLDADGQHYPEDIPTLLNAGEKNPQAIIVGSRSFGDDNMPGGNVFANKFSNFWFTVQTLQCLPDTQTGFRLYPLRKIGGLRVLTSRYEAELEILVFSAWRGTKLIPVSVNVYYPSPEARVTHFRPGRDFARISILNTILCLLAIVYGGPKILINYLAKKIKS